MRLIVTGGRHYGRRHGEGGVVRPAGEWQAERRHVFDVLDRVHAKRPVTRLVQGGAKGADEAARDWAHARGVQVVTYEYPENGGRAGGPTRNGNMVADGADGAVAFPGGSGTASCCELLAKAGIKVLDERAKGPKAGGR